MKSNRCETLEASSSESGRSLGFETENNGFLPSGNHNIQFPGNLEGSTDNFSGNIDNQQNGQVDKLYISKIDDKDGQGLKNVESYRFEEKGSEKLKESSELLAISSKMVTEDGDSDKVISNDLNYDIKNAYLQKYLNELKQSEIIEVENSELDSKTIFEKSETQKMNSSLQNSLYTPVKQESRLYDSVILKNKPLHKYQKVSLDGIDNENKYNDLQFTDKTKDTDRKTKTFENDDEASNLEDISKLDFNTDRPKIFSEDSPLDRSSITKNDARYSNVEIDSDGSKVITKEVIVENVRVVPEEVFEEKKVEVDRIYLKKVPRYRNKYIEVIVY